MEKRALSQNEFISSDFDGREYQYVEDEGTFTATLVCKRWCKKCNMLAYFDFDDGRKVAASAWNTTNYLGLGEIPSGSKVKLTFKNSKKGVSYLREVERI